VGHPGPPGRRVEDRRVAGWRAAGPPGGGPPVATAPATGGARCRGRRAPEGWRSVRRARRGL